MAANGVTTVLFDRDDTLCAFPHDLDDLLADAFERAGLEPFFDAADARRWVERVDADSQFELRAECFRRLAEEHGRDPGDAERFARAYGDPEPTDVEFCPSAEAVLDALHERYRLGLVSNGATERQRAKLDALDVREHFDAVVCAEPGRPVKPDSGPFHCALDSLDVGPAECVHVGDSLASDVAGAQAVGIDAVWVPPNGDASVGPDDPDPEYVVESRGGLLEPPRE